MGLLSLVFGGVEGIISEILEQFNNVQELAISPLKVIIEQVVGGVWVGEGADAFVKELESLAIPGIGQVGDSINQFGKNVTSSVDLIRAADEAVSGIISSVLDDAFSFF
jgi:hypothetical protein